MYKLCFYVPIDHCETVKAAVFNAGGGKLGDYEHCSWQTQGEGQFKPLAGSQPYQGETDKLEKVTEYKVELVCTDAYIVQVIHALKQAHPYEEPAYQVIKLEEF